MPLSSAVRKRVVAVAGRLLALREESATPLQAANLLISGGVVPGSELIDETAPFAVAIRRSIPESGARVADYVQAAEQQGRGEEALRFLSRVDSASRRWQGPLLLASVEFASLLFVLLIYGLFVLPQFRAVFEAAGARLPQFTELVTTLVAPASPLAWLMVLALLILFAWRFVALLLGPLVRPLDRLALALPEIGDMLKHGNAVRLAGWLGHGSSDPAATRLALEAARSWHPRSTLTRACDAVLAQARKGRELFACLADSDAFDRDFRATVAQPATALLSLRARWRSSSDAVELPHGAFAKLIHAVIIVVIGAVIVALYLPIFKLAAMT